MNVFERVIWALVLVLLDMSIPFFPIGTFFIAFIFIARPTFFKEWILKLYQTK